MADPIDIVLPRLRQVRRTKPNCGVASCPAHKDDSPSLSFKELPGGKLLLHCFAGCCINDVLEAMGLDMSDLYPEGLSVEALRTYQLAAAKTAKEDAELIIEAARASSVLSPEDQLYLEQAKANLGKLKETLLQLNGMATVSELAALQELAYLQVRKARASDLGISVGQLDKLRKVEQVRLAKEAVQQAGSSNVLFEEVEPWAEPVNGAHLLDELSATVLRFVVCHPHTADAAALWVTFSWCIDALTVAPIANITAPLPNCGKSTMLELLERLSFRPLKVDNISAAALFRSIDRWHPTLLIDEVDAFLRDNEHARGILNSGHGRGGSVVRLVGEEHEPRRFSTWGAKALCGIGSIASTLQSRSIRLELRRKLPHEKVENLRHTEISTFQRLQRQLARFSADSHAYLLGARPAPVPGLNNRAVDNWEPLLAIADAAGGEWPQRSRRAALAISGPGMGEEAPELGVELLKDIRVIFEQEKVDRMSSASLLRALCEDAESLWATRKGGKPMTPRQLATSLGEFGIVSGTVRFGETTAKGYTLDRFADAFSRYLPPARDTTVTPSQASNDAGYDAGQSRHSAKVLPIKELRKSSSDAGCDGVTGSSSEPCSVPVGNP